MATAEIRLSRRALLNNVQSLRTAGDNIALFPVIKANAYGHGASLIAHELERHFDEAALPLFCVAQYSEALELRAAGVKRRLLVLSSFEANDLSSSLGANLSFVLSDQRDLENFRNLELQKQASSRVHLNINTGMNRLGLSSERILAGEYDDILEGLARSPGIVEGVMTHLARSEEDAEIFTAQQASSFNKVLDKILPLFQGKSKEAFWIHLANSAAVEQRLLTGRVNAARPGLRIYGVYQDLADRSQQDAENLSAFQPVLKVIAPIRSCFRVAAGEGAGYGQRFRAQRDSILATLCIGYADGLRRSLGPRQNSVGEGGFFLRGHFVPVAGTVSMDMVMVDLTEHPECSKIEEDWRTGKSVECEWIGPHQLVEEIASQLSTISYEIFCGLSHRLPRRWVED